MGAGAGPVRYRRAPGVVHRSVDGVVLVVGTDGQPRDLEGGAGIVWDVLDVPSTVTEVAAAVERLVHGEGPVLDAVQAALDLLTESDLVVTDV
jgi:hypothetical protein